MGNIWELTSSYSNQSGSQTLPHHRQRLKVRVSQVCAQRVNAVAGMAVLTRKAVQHILT